MWTSFKDNELGSGAYIRFLSRRTFIIADLNNISIFRRGNRINDRTFSLLILWNVPLCEKLVTNRFRNYTNRSTCRQISFHSMEWFTRDKNTNFARRILNIVTKKNYTLNTIQFKSLSDTNCHTDMLKKANFPSTNIMRNSARIKKISIMRT